MKLFLFDIDGTLVLTGGAGTRAMTRAFEEVFRVPDGFDGIPMAGRTDSLILAEALRRQGLALDAGAQTQFVARYCRRLAEEIVAPGPRKGVMPGVPELLVALGRRDDVFLALLTGNFADGARIKLEHFGLWRHFVCGAYGDDAQERLDLVPIALDRARASGAPVVDRSDVLIVGDTPLDVACAVGAGARAIAVATGPYDVETLQAAGADVVFPDLGDLDAFLAIL